MCVCVCVQLASLVPDVQVIAACSLPKHRVVHAHGASHCIEYANLRAECKRITMGKGVDLVIDCVGGDAADAVISGGAYFCVCVVIFNIFILYFF